MSSFAELQAEAYAAFRKPQTPAPAKAEARRKAEWDAKQAKKKAAR